MLVASFGPHVSFFLIVFGFILTGCFKAPTYVEEAIRLANKPDSTFEKELDGPR